MALDKNPDVHLYFGTVWRVGFAVLFVTCQSVQHPGEVLGGGEIKNVDVAVGLVVTLTQMGLCVLGSYQDGCVVLVLIG